MDKIVTKKQQLLQKLITDYDKNLNNQILLVCLIYIGLSISWNLIFKWFNVPFSRAHIGVLILCFVVQLAVFWVFHIVNIPQKIRTHIVLLFVIFVTISLYFGSGYSESWSYFLLIPIISSLYGKRALSIYYSIIGLLSLSIISIVYPINPQYVTDGIDISNRILLYLIIATFSYLLLSKLNMLYNKQVNTVVTSLETTLEQVAKSFIIAMEAKDHYTFGHSERVSQYAVALGKQLPEYHDEQQLKHLRLSGLLHDIGKINISEDILTKLTKLTKLTDTEYDIIKTHTTFGAQMIEKIEGLEELKSGVLYHHERWDGKGYPSELKASEIPLDARILALADSFDAMTSTRSYQDEHFIEEAFQELEKGLGTQFDPNLSEALSAAKPEFSKIYSEYHNPLNEFEKLTDFL
ncbi:HD-GYP domain-containing protein [Marinilactibacillus psychrotolerans]|uniref:HD-GYP domain-containing protein n=1 Tax=Marinilactibacillus psychrotolerans TaxID=191770 RepID=UPI003884FF2B